MAMNKKTGREKVPAIVKSIPMSGVILSVVKPWRIGAYVADGDAINYAGSPFAAMASMLPNSIAMKEPH
jgi:hypothetical protein